jgi:hypothetical protein
MAFPDDADMEFGGTAKPQARIAENMSSRTNRQLLADDLASLLEEREREFR